MHSRIWIAAIGIATGVASTGCMASAAREPTDEELEAFDLDSVLTAADDKADSLKAPTAMGELALDAEPIEAAFVPITDGFHEWTFEVHPTDTFVRFQIQELADPTAESRRELGAFLYLRVIPPRGRWSSSYGVFAPAHGDPLDDHPSVGAARLFFSKQSHDLVPGTYRVIATSQRNLKAAWSGGRPRTTASYAIFATTRRS